MNAAIRDFVVNCTGNAVTLLISIGSGVLAARYLGPEGRGELAAIQLIPLYLVVVAALGGFQSLVYYSAKDDGRRAGEFLASATVAALLAAIPICIIGFFLQQAFLVHYPDRIQIAGALFLLFVPINILYALPWSAIFGRGHFVAWNLLKVEPQLLYVLAIVAVIALGDPKAELIAGLYLAGLAVICVPTAWAVFRSKVRQRLSVRPAGYFDQARYGFISMLHTLPQSINQRLDQVFVAYLLPPNELGLYAVAAGWASILQAILTSLGAVAFPRLARLSGSAADSVLQVTVRWAVALSAILFVSLAVISPTVIPVFFGEKFRPSIAPSIILLAACAFGALNAALADAFRGLGRPEVPLKSELAGLSVSILIIGFLTAKFGVIGAAFGSVAATTIACSYTVWILIKERRLQFHWIAEFRREIHDVLKQKT